MSERERGVGNRTDMPADVHVRVRALTKHFPVRIGAFGERRANVHAVDDVSFDVLRGETLGLVGESGCGKSTTGYAMLQLHRPTAGQVLFDGMDLAALDDEALRPLRRRLQIIFQDPYSTLSPRMTVGAAIAEPLWLHRRVERNAIDARTGELLERVGLQASLSIRYPHEFSGGQRQRICIARALACDPEFIVCDEPVSALDVSIQAQIINLLKELQDTLGLTYLFIAHDLAVVRHISDRIAVMYLGRMVELAPSRRLFAQPLHPYTDALLQSVPIPNPRLERQRNRKVIAGNIPSALEPPTGCRFHPRCPLAFEPCSEVVPEWREVEDGHWVACHAVE